MVYYRQWATASGEAPSEVGLLDPVGLLVMQPQTMHWTDNIIQLANYKFQIQTSQDQTGQTSGQYSIVSIRPADQFPVDGSQNPVTLPDTFVSQVPSNHHSAGRQLD